MSASAKKKQRKNDEALGGLTQQERREQKETVVKKRNRILYTIVAVVCVIAIAVLLIWNRKDSFHKSAAAVTIDGEKYKVCDLQYYYSQARNNLIYQNQYFSSAYGYNISSFDSSLSDGAQWYNEAEGKTYADYFRESACNALKRTVVLCKEAEKNGYALSETGKKQIDSSFDSIDVTCARYGMTRGYYFSSQYGNGVTEKVFRKNLENDVLADEYAQYYEDNISYDDEALDGYYKEHADELDSYDYRVFTIDGTAPSSLDKDGNTVEATEEEKNAAMEAAKENAKAALAEIEAADDRETAFCEAAPKYVAETSKDAYSDPASTLNTAVLGSNIASSSMGTWLTDSARKQGDVTSIENTSGVQIVMFVDRYLVKDPTVDVRHILIRPETDDDAETNEYGTAKPTEAQMSEAKEKIDALYDEWNNLTDEEKTAEKFGEMANENSDDGGSNTKGGRYSYVTKGSMVPPFDAWIFDPSRQPGDVGIVENNGDDVSYYGWHLIYFEKSEDPAWKGTAITDKQASDQTEWLNGLLDAVVLDEQSGLQYVGVADTAEPTPTESPSDSEDVNTETSSEESTESTESAN